MSVCYETTRLQGFRSDPTKLDFTTSEILKFWIMGLRKLKLVTLAIVYLSLAKKEDDRQHFFHKLEFFFFLLTWLKRSMCTI